MTATFRRAKASAAIFILFLCVFLFLTSISDPGFLIDGRGLGPRSAFYDILFLLRRPMQQAGFGGLMIFTIFCIWTMYLPCALNRDLNILDQSFIGGLDFWGKKARLSFSEIRTVTVKKYFVTVRGIGQSLWIPLFLLHLSDEQKVDFVSCLETMVSQSKGRQSIRFL